MVAIKAVIVVVYPMVSDRRLEHFIFERKSMCLSVDQVEIGYLHIKTET